MLRRTFKMIFLFYYNGFKSMTVGKKLWIIIIIKLFLIFVVLKLFFFKDFLKEKYSSEDDKSKYVLEEMLKR